MRTIIAVVLCLCFVGLDGVQVIPSDVPHIRVSSVQDSGGELTVTSPVALLKGGEWQSALLAGGQSNCAPVWVRFDMGKTYMLDNDDMAVMKITRPNGTTAYEIWAGTTAPNVLLWNESKVTNDSDYTYAFLGNSSFVSHPFYFRYLEIRCTENPGYVGFVSVQLYATPHAQYGCGNHIRAPEEQCDSTSPCCSPECEFMNSSTICDASKGIFCTGVNDICEVNNQPQGFCDNHPGNYNTSEVCGNRIIVCPNNGIRSALSTTLTSRALLAEANTSATLTSSTTAFNASTTSTTLTSSTTAFNASTTSSTFRPIAQTTTTGYDDSYDSSSSALSSGAIAGIVVAGVGIVGVILSGVIILILLTNKRRVIPNRVAPMR